MKTAYRIGTNIILVVVVFWIVETCIFLYLYGWHWKATTDVEKLCDSIVSVGSFIGWAFLLWAWIGCMEFTFKIKDAIESEDEEDVD